MNPSELAALEHDWHFWGRQNQFAPAGDWQTWLVCAGRGFGKTRTGAEWVREQVELHGKQRIALVGPTAADTRDVMVEGESGLLNCFPPDKRPLYESSKRKVTFHTGAIAMLYSSEEPERLRGPQHDAAWLDELCAWSRMQSTYDMLQFGLRLGNNPQSIITTTPKPLPLLREILADPGTVVTRGNTYDNQKNLAKKFIEKIIRKYEGTRLGLQELNAQVLDDIPGALWTWPVIEQARWFGVCPEWVYRVVAIDPSVGDGNPENDECGIVVAGLGRDNMGYVLNDSSMTDEPEAWASRAVELYRELKCDWIIAEANNGGKLIESAIRAQPGGAGIPVKLVHASQGKRTRAEPVSMLYQQGRVRHFGIYPELENQMTNWSPKESDFSPGRMDALVWALTALMVEDASEFFCF